MSDESESRRETMLEAGLLWGTINRGRRSAPEIVAAIGRDQACELWEDVMALAAALYAAMENKEAKHD